MKVKIYVSNHCPACLAAVNYLISRGISFEQMDVSYDRENFNEMLNFGGIATPLIVIGETVLHSFEPLKIERLLAVTDKTSS